MGVHIRVSKTDIGKLIMSELNFDLVVQQINDQLRELRQQEETANNKKLELDGVLGKLRTELQQLNPLLRNLGEEIFNSAGSTIEHTKLKPVFEKVKKIKLDLFEAQAKKINREKAKESFFGKIKSFAENIFDPDLTQTYEEQLKESYVDLVKAVIASDENSHIKGLVPEALVSQLSEIEHSISNYSNERIAVGSELNLITTQVNSLIDTVKRSIVQANTFVEVEKGLAEFDSRKQSELLKYARYYFEGLENDSLAVCAYIKAGKYFEASVARGDFLSKEGDASKKITALSNISYEYIKAEQFEDAIKVAEDIYFLRIKDNGNATETEINNLKLREYSKIICELIQQEKLDKPLVFDCVLEFKGDNLTQVNEFSNIACQYIKTGQFKDGNRLVHRIIVTKANKTEKITALSKISQAFLSVGQSNDAFQIDRIIAGW